MSFITLFVAAKIAFIILGTIAVIMGGLLAIGIGLIYLGTRNGGRQ